MASTEKTSSAPVNPRAVFATTHWSVVLSAADSDTHHARDALARLCQSYWYPLYTYVRRRGYAAHDAQDLTQAFFLRLMERRWVANADRERGRFRTFLLTALQRFLADEWDRGRAQKRGGGVQHVPVQLDSAEIRYGHEPADELTHATGHKARLNRPTLTESAGFGSNPYCKEELIAEMGAAFLCGQAGIAENIIENSAAYLQNWLEQLQNYKSLIVQAAAQAQKAADFILGTKFDGTPASESAEVAA